VKDDCLDIVLEMDGMERNSIVFVLMMNIE